MKKIVLLIYCSCVLLLQGKAQQQYQPIFGEHTTEWTVTPGYVTLDGTNWMDTILTEVIEGEYKILEYKSRWSGGNYSMGKIRSNETNSKLYYIAPNALEEELIMDLDLEIGDSFSLKYRLFNSDFEEKIVVDSVYVQDGKKHIRFDQVIGTSTPPGEIRRMFIEGVGPNWSFPSYGIRVVVCKYTDSVFDYSFENEYIKDCTYRHLLYIENPIKEKDIKIHPNPASESVTIHIPAIADLSVYNALGVKVFDKKLFDLETVLDISHLPSNIYYFEFQMIDETITKKIVKH